ncbi:CgeB family protein [Rhodoplanes roseus]|uniref:Glycosyltransferase n=1 Tax=Rhodoplanes roseus TaxID=29409 RepID=A0A327L3J0_9BRAD|nr:glycosyltransferase [Rhodoplanes roseus]RAI45091.1 glycosyltransferase [Rhodoplanes roseus]
MKIVVFGLTVSSSWGNGHATLWRGLIAALAARGHRTVFFERDVPYYAMNRDLEALPDGELALYRDFEEERRRAERVLADADVAIVTSYCPDGRAAAELVMAAARPIKIFYDLDTPVTLANLRDGESVPYLPADGLAGFDLVLSYTGGRALDELAERLGARRTAPLYGHVDPRVHRPVAPAAHYRADLSYLGTYASDRQPALEALLVGPAARRPDLRFLIGGAQYPQQFPWGDNIWFVRHLPPSEHPAFFCSSRLTLNITRKAMADMGWCPSGRLFEAAACGAAMVTDAWDGLDTFFTPGDEVLVATSASHIDAALDLSDAEIARLGRAARERTLSSHTSMHRAATLEQLIEEIAGRGLTPPPAARATPFRAMEA